jgi:hypothetical protein
LVPWALYTLLTALLFHVELRYRLPLYPALLPYAAWALVRMFERRFWIVDWKQVSSKIQDPKPKLLLSGLTCLLILGVILLHRPYVHEAWSLAWKHTRLWQAERAHVRGDAPGAQAAAQAALKWDADSALARVALARAALLEGSQTRALEMLDAAVAALPAHPHAHLLRGAILRAEGQQDSARAELAFERNSLEDLQGWAWEVFAPIAPAPAALQVGGGLDLGFVHGFWLAEAAAYRWSSAESQIALLAPAGTARLDLQLASGRPAGAPPVELEVAADGRALGRLQLETNWHTYNLPLDHPPGRIVLTLRSPTFRPRDYDRASPDDRALGAMVGQVALRSP